MPTSSGAGRHLGAPHLAHPPRALSFLYADLEPEYYYFEIVQTYQKLFLVGFAVLLDFGKVARLLAALAVAMLFGVAAAAQALPAPR